MDVGLFLTPPSCRLSVHTVQTNKALQVALMSVAVAAAAVVVAVVVHVVVVVVVVGGRLLLLLLDCFFELVLSFLFESFLLILNILLLDVQHAELVLELYIMV